MISILIDREVGREHEERRGDPIAEDELKIREEGIESLIVDAADDDGQDERLRKIARRENELHFYGVFLEMGNIALPQIGGTMQEFPEQGSIDLELAGGHGKIVGFGHEHAGLKAPVRRTEDYDGAYLAA